MNAYRGHLTTVVGDGPEVVIKLSDDNVRVLTPDGRVHTWPSDDVRVTGISGDRFWIAFQGEIAVFAPEEPQAFMLEFLPGLKAARTVADAIAAANEPDDLPEDDDRSTWTPDGGPRTIEKPIATPEPARRHVVAHKAHLPQLAGHVEARLTGVTVNGSEPEAPAAPDPKRRWWSRGQTPPQLRPREADEDGPEDNITVDLTDSGLDAAPDDPTISSVVGRMESASPEDGDDGPPADRASDSTLLRDLSNRHQAFEAERRGTYRPRR